MNILSQQQLLCAPVRTTTPGILEIGPELILTPLENPALIRQQRS